MTRILLTTTSFQDNPGEHHKALEKTGWEIVRARGPLPEEEMLRLAGEVDAFLCGDDLITRKVLEKALPRLRVISKYGIGVDKIDVEAATELGIPLTNCPGVNHTTVAEHTFCLMLALFRNLAEEAGHTRAGEWKRLTGHEIMGKTIGIIGLGRIGKEVAVRAKAFAMKPRAYDIYWDEAFAGEHGLEREEDLDRLIETSDIISLHTSANEQTRGMINAGRVARMKDGVVIVNTARGELVETAAVAQGLESGKIAGYGADVLEREPPPPDHPLLKAKNSLITPHIGSRTYESVQRQAMMAVRNLVLAMSGEPPLAQVNSVPIRKE